ncbi:hypothetical protein [Synechococcus sp. Cu2B8-bc1011]|uniref:hypothetical protein n=1 Tax=Synechococcus sp. Cu2B8-bc1011 TaxID=3093725 RepID=UPI0039B0D14E
MRWDKTKLVMVLASLPTASRACLTDRRCSEYRHGRGRSVDDGEAVLDRSLGDGVDVSTVG